MAGEGTKFSRTQQAKHPKKMIGVTCLKGHNPIAETANISTQATKATNSINKLGTRNFAGLVDLLGA